VDRVLDLAGFEQKSYRWGEWMKKIIILSPPPV
jgi:hypothetical protein